MGQFWLCKKSVTSVGLERVESMFCDWVRCSPVGLCWDGYKAHISPWLWFKFKSRCLTMNSCINMQNKQSFMYTVRVCDIWALSFGRLPFHRPITQGIVKKQLSSQNQAYNKNSQMQVLAYMSDIVRNYRCIPYLSPPYSAKLTI